MTRMQVKMTFAFPEQLCPTTDEFGRRVVGRIPQHPTRPARSFELNTWWEDCTADQAIDLARGGHLVRVAPALGIA